MTTEEKAKAYDNIIEKANKMHGENCEACQICIEELIPELAESEDEKIRGAIIDHLKDSNLTEWAAWLEKQGEQKPAENKGMNLVEEEMTPFQKKVFCIIDTTIEEEQGLKQVCDELLTLASNEIKQKPTTEIKSAEESLGIDSETYNKIVDECIYGEQKPADKVEPKFKVGQTIKKEGFNLGFPIVKIENGFYYNDMGDNFPFTDQDNWKLVEQKPAWSEEDEKIINGITSYLCTHDSCELDGFDKWYDFLKSLKNRVQPQPRQEWSGEDEKCLENAIMYCEWARDKAPDLHCYETSEKSINWLKSLRPQKQWKPSEEQMHYLSWIANIKLGDSVVEQEVSKHLNELLEDLKKLK